MELEEYRRQLLQSPEYAEAYKTLKPKLDLGRQILDLRLERRWSQKELAKRAGTKQANISRLENGLSNPSLNVLQKIADAFDAQLVIQITPRKEILLLETVQTPGLFTLQSDAPSSADRIPIPNWPTRSDLYLGDQADSAQTAPQGI
jgi:transcriptional regulator with XRE-family HTH domain